MGGINVAIPACRPNPELQQIGDINVATPKLDPIGKVNAARPTSLRPPAVKAALAAPDTMERETGFEPATPSLEGWRSTAELFPPEMSCRTLQTGVSRRKFKRLVRATEPPRSCLRPRTVEPEHAAPATTKPGRVWLRPPTGESGLAAPATMVGRGGFEPPKAYASRFTVCPLWPLGYLPEPAGMR